MNVDRVVDLWTSHNAVKSPTPDERNTAITWARVNASINPKPLEDVLKDVYGDGYLLGNDVARELLTGEATFDWDTWKPGDSQAADLVRDSGGLRDLLDRTDVTIKGLNETSLDRLGSALANALDQGLTGRETAALIRDTIASPERALTIAVTETRRAASVASMEAYQLAGVTQVEWLIAEGDECEDCAANNDESPIPMGDAFPSGDTEPPAHPNCRCAVSPVIEDTISPEQFDALFASETGE